MSGRRSRRVIGLMSGTSCDGVDAVLVDIVGRGTGMRVALLRHEHYHYPAKLRRRLLAVMAPADTTTQEVCDLDVAVGREFAAAARRLLRAAGCEPRDVDLTGSHGQTICHLPPRRRGFGCSLQIGDAATIAVRTGIPVVSDFRQADMAAGGQGAPLVPWTDYVLLRDRRRSRVVQNIGGIANLTYLAAGGGLQDVIAFDTGPGNMIIDELVRRTTNGRESFDHDGRRAARGVIDRRLLRRWLADPFLRRRPPKSCGREQFGAAFVDAAVGAGKTVDRADDLIATATALTVGSMVEAYRRFLPGRSGRPRIDQIIVCGGGARNATMLRMLAEGLPGAEVTPIDRMGIGEQAKEAVSFAMLAAACVDGVPANLPQVTGASRAAILGRITPVAATGR